MKWISAVVLFSGALADERFVSRRDEIANLTARQLEELKADNREFDAMEKKQRAALEALAAALAKAPDRSALESTMIRFARWVDTLTPAQKGKLDAAVSTTERLAVVRKLIEEQKTQLDKDLKRLREHEATGAEIPFVRRFGVFPQSGPEEVQRRVKQLNEKMSQSEKRQLGRLRISSPRDAAALSFILGIKHGVVTLPANFGDWIPRVLPEQFRETEFYLRSFGGLPYSDLSSADRVRIRELIELSFSLPEVTQGMVLLAYPMNDPRRRLYRSMFEEFSARPFALIYYFDHPGELAASESKQRFERLRKRNSDVVPATEEKPVRPTLKEYGEKIRRKRAAKDARDG